MSDIREPETDDTIIDAPPDPASDTPPADDLGDAGKKAIDAMKAKWKAERDRANGLDARVKELTKPPADAPPDLDALRAEAKAEAFQETLKERALDKLETRAAKLFADPEDARALLAGRVDEFLDDGKVDTAAITEALNDLLARKPHLAATAPPRFAGSGDGGARNGSASQVTQLTENDLKNMRPEQIEKARQKGQLRDYLGAS
jgi:hypothetical protein